MKVDLFDFELPNERIALRPAVPRDAARMLADRVNTELEALILKQPDQYLWLHDRYRDAPEK